MKKIAILTALLFITVALHSQNLKKITIEEMPRGEIRENFCANYDSAKYNYATIVFNTNLPDLKFEIVNAQGRLIYQKREIEKNRYILCVEPMNELYNVYRIEISGQDVIVTNYVYIDDIIPKDKRFYLITSELDQTTVKKSKPEKKRIKETRSSEDLVSYPKKTFFELNFSWSPQPQTAYGFTVGQFKRIGWYLSFMSNFNFKKIKGAIESNNKNGYINGELPFYSGKISTPRISAIVGFTGKILPSLAICVGAGFGYRTLFKEAVDKQWIKNKYYSTIGADIESGFLFDIKGFTLSAGVVTTNFKFIDLKVGIGFALKHKNNNQK